MCDVVVAKRSGTIFFAKNSDRDANEAQLLEWHPARRHRAGETVECSYLSVPQARHTHATIISRPFWLWGAEMAANEHGVVIGNEAVFTRERAGKIGLTGMDMLRLAAERAESAEQAATLLVDWHHTYGQGGGGSLERGDFRYFSSFLIADPSSIWLVETAGRDAIADRLDGTYAISNALTNRELAARHDWRLASAVAGAAKRRARTSELGRGSDSVLDWIRVLSDHGGCATTASPSYSLIRGHLDSPCQHGAGLLAGSVTTSSWVAEIGPEGLSLWVSATSAPCISVFKPVRVDEPLDVARRGADVYDERSLWWRHERFHRLYLRDPGGQRPLFADERDALQRRLLDERPTGAESFRLADEALASWSARLDAAQVRERRPAALRWYWARQNRAAQIVLS